MIKRIVFSIVLVILALTGCKHEAGHNGALTQVDSLLTEGAVDTAYARLENILPSGLRSADDSAYYFLLYSQAAYRLYKPVSYMDKLDYCIRHYSQTSAEKEKLATAYYYKGMTLYDGGNVRDGIFFLKNAEYIANGMENMELRHKVYESLVVVNEEADEINTAMDYARKSLAVSVKAGKLNWQAHAYNNMAVIHNRMGDSDSASFYIKRCMSQLKHIPQKDRIFIMNNIGVYLMHTDVKLAKQYFLHIIKTYPIEEAYENLANICIREDKLDQAEWLLGKALATNDLQVKSEVLATLQQLQRKKKEYEKALATTDRLISIKDTMLEIRNSNNVKAMQAEFDNAKSHELYERQITLGICLIVGMFLVLTIIFFYSRYKTYKTKAAITKDQMLIKNYERQVADLQRLGNDKEKEIELINRRKEKLLDKHRDTLNRGYTLFSEIMEGKTTVLWKKHDFESVIEYYRLVDIEYVDVIENSYDGLSPKYMFCLILEHTGKTDQEIMQIMGLAEVSLRSVRSRINKKKR